MTKLKQHFNTQISEILKCVAIICDTNTLINIKSDFMRRGLIFRKIWSRNPGLKLHVKTLISLTHRTLL